MQTTIRISALIPNDVIRTISDGANGGLVELEEVELLGVDEVEVVSVEEVVVICFSQVQTSH